MLRYERDIYTLLIFILSLTDTCYIAAWAFEAPGNYQRDVDKQIFMWQLTRPLVFQRLHRALNSVFNDDKLPTVTKPEKRYWHKTDCYISVLYITPFFCLFPCLLVFFHKSDVRISLTACTECELRAAVPWLFMSHSVDSLKSLSDTAESDAALEARFK